MASPKKPQQNFESLLLNTPENEKIELKPEQLEHWVKENYPDSKSVGRFGMKSAKDVIAFLNSPAGTTVKEMIAEELAYIAAVENERRIEMQDQEHMRHRMLSFLLLSLLASRDAKAKKQHIQAQEQLDILLKKRKSMDNPPATFELARDSIIDAYNAQLSVLNTELTDLHSERDLIEQLLEQHELEAQDMQARHAVLNEALSRIDLLLSAPDIQLLIQQEQEVPVQVRQNAIELISSRMAAIAQEIESQTNQTSEQMASAQPQVSRDQINSLHRMLFEQTYLRDILEVAQGEKRLYNLEGERVNSFMEANFILRTNQKLVMHEGEIYLLNENDDIHQMGNEAKSEAAKSFKQNQDSMITVPKVIENNQQRELAQQQSTKEMLEQRQQNNAEQIQSKMTQISELETARDNSAEQLKRPDLMLRPSPKMAPSNVSNKKEAPRPEPKKMTKKEQIQFIREVRYLQENPKEANRERLDALMQLNPAAMPYLNQALLGIPRSAPIPDMTMQSLLKHLERFGVDATKENVTPINGPLEQREENKNAPSKEPEEKPEEPRHYNNPFDMTNKPK